MTAEDSATNAASGSTNDSLGVSLIGSNDGPMGAQVEIKDEEAEDSEFGAFVEPSPLFAEADMDPLSSSDASGSAAVDNPLTPTTAGPLGGTPASAKPAQGNHLLDEIMNYERNPASLFSDPQFEKPTTTTDSTTPIVDYLSHVKIAENPVTPTAVTPIPTSFDPLGPGGTSQAIPTPESGSGLTPSQSPQPQPHSLPQMSVEPTANGGVPGIERNLGLIDHDYFSSREPAEAIPIVSTPDPGLPSETDHIAASAALTPTQDSRPSRSPSWTVKSLLTPQLSSPSRSRERSREHPLQASSGEDGLPGAPTSATHHHRPRHHRRQPSSPTLAYAQPAPPIVTPGVVNDFLDWDQDAQQATNLPTPHPLDLPTPVSIPESDLWRDDPNVDQNPPVSTTYATLSSIPSWIGSLLAGGSAEPDAMRARPSTRGRPSSSSSSSSLYSDERGLRRNTNELAVPEQFTASPSPVSSPEPQPQPPTAFAKHTSTASPPGGYGHVRGQHGRPLPRAHPSLETIQQLYANNPNTHPHQALSQPGIQSVNITHSTPFAPPPATLASASLSPFGTPLNVGFSPVAKAATLPTSGPGGSGSTSSNPFGTHTFTQISGAPGFKPDEYDWDKGFSDDLEQELRDDFGQRRGRKQEENVSGLGSRFGFGFRRKTSSERVPTVNPRPGSSSSSTGNVYGHGKALTEPTLLGGSMSSTHAEKLAGRGRSPSRGATAPGSVSQLIEKKVGNIALKGRKETTEAVLNQELADLIRPHLPPLSRLPKTWTLLYSLDQHGISLNTLYSNCEAPERNRKAGQSYVGIGGVIVILRDSDTSSSSVDGTFGAFIAEGLGRKSKGFFGGGDSFLWKYTNGHLQVFKATGRNTYFAICESGYIAFGGGSTSYGLYIDSGLLEGYSAPSVTFGNEALCNSASGTTPAPSRPGDSSSHSNLTREVGFECVGLEVWGIGPT